MKMMKRAMFGGVIAAAVAAGVAHAGTPAALDKPAFTATPAELLAAAKTAAPGDSEAVVLLDDTDISFDAQGRATEKSRTVFVVATKEGVDEWGDLAATWVPAYQDKPQLRARVIDASGRAFELDLASATEAPDGNAATALPTDRRRLSVPLPHLAIGAVVEEQVITVDRDVVPGGAVTHGLGVGARVPVLDQRLRYTAAKKLSSVAFGVPAGVKPKTETSAGRHIVTYRIGSVTPREEYEGYATADARPFRYIQAAPATSWNAIAREYRAIVDKRIAEGAITLPADIPKGGGEDAVRAVLAWLDRQVQDTGVAFNDAAFVPSTPADTLKRASAGSTDHAVLLLAALRQAGVRAELALINEGPGPDLDREVPAINQFDHAIVRAHVGKTELWLDPAERLARPGVLPVFDRGRLALLIADDASALITTPAPAGTDNLVREVRTFEIAEDGAAKVIELSREGGVFEAEQRVWFHDTAPATVRKNLGDYVKGQYKGALDTYSATPVDDLTKPFELTVTVSDTAWAYTDRDDAKVSLYPTDLLKKLPQPLGDPKADERARKLDFNLSTPHVYEIEYRLVAPPGFTVPRVAPDKTRELGVFRLLEKQRVDGQALVVTLRFEALKTRLTPADVTKVQQAIRELRNEAAIRFVFPHTATTLAQQGKLRDAIAEANRVIKLHPKEALHYQQLAAVLLTCGAGEAARRAARKATELEPKNADAFVVLGWVLERDSFGNFLGFDHDHAGAIAAFRTAHKLNPKHVGAAAELAAELERDAHGRRFEIDVDLRGAIDAWRDAYTLDPSNIDHAYAYATALIWGGQGAEAEKVLRAMPVAERRDELLTTATAISSGPDAAVRVADSLANGSTRTKYLQAAMGILMFTRRYDAMRALRTAMQATQTGNPYEVMLQKLQRFDKPFKPTKTPEDTMLEGMLVLFLPGRPGNPYWDAKTREEEEAGLHTMRQMWTKSPLINRGVVEDMLRATLKMTTEGDDKVWRIEVDEMGHKAPAYVASDRGTPKIIGDDALPEGVGRHILRLLAKNDEKSAAKLLDWLAKDLAPHARSNGLAQRFGFLWGTNLPRARKDMEVAATMLTGETDPAAAIPILEKCKPSTKDGQLACDWALAHLYARGARWTELQQYAHDWGTRAPHDMSMPAIMEAYALAHLGRLDDADRVVADQLAKDPDDFGLIHTHADLAVARGQLAEGVKRLEALTKQSSSQAPALNDLAWLKMVEGSDLPNAVLLARQAAQLEPKEHNILNTVAAAEVEAGELGAGKQHLDAALETSEKVRPLDPDLYVHGRLLEQLGFSDDAIAIYRQIKPDTGYGYVPNSGELAKRRLKALGVKK
jgi:tetratricopeptide (TPR) repeat protein